MHRSANLHTLLISENVYKQRWYANTINFDPKNNRRYCVNRLSWLFSFWLGKMTALRLLWTATLADLWSSTSIIYNDYHCLPLKKIWFLEKLTRSQHKKCRIMLSKFYKYVGCMVWKVQHNWSHSVWSCVIKRNNAML